MNKYKIIFFIPILIISKLMGTGLTFTFGTGTITGQDSTHYEFTIQIQATGSNTYLGDTQIYLNYNTAVFGEFIDKHERVEVIKSGLIVNKSEYGNPIVKDNGPGCLAITVVYNTPGQQGNSTQVPTWPDHLVHVKIAFTKRVGSVGLSFNETLMASQQYQYNNTTQYTPIDATDTDGTFVTNKSTVILQPGPESVQDNYLYYVTNWSGSMDENNGSNEQIKLGNVSGYGYYKRNRGLFKFDVSGIDSGSYVNEVKFRLKIRANECNASYQYLDIHKVLVTWAELTSCWNRSETGGSNWAGCAPNNQYASSTISAYLYRNSSASGWLEWTSAGLRDMVQYWTDHTNENYGFLLKLRNDDVNADHLFRFHSSDVTDPAIRPVLEITYQAGQ